MATAKFTQGKRVVECEVGSSTYKILDRSTKWTLQKEGEAQTEQTEEQAPQPEPESKPEPEPKSEEDQKLEADIQQMAKGLEKR